MGNALRVHRFLIALTDSESSSEAAPKKGRDTKRRKLRRKTAGGEDRRAQPRHPYPPPRPQGVSEVLLVFVAIGCSGTPIFSI